MGCSIPTKAIRIAVVATAMRDVEEGAQENACVSVSAVTRDEELDVAHACTRVQMAESALCCKSDLISWLHDLLIHTGGAILLRLERSHSFFGQASNFST